MALWVNGMNPREKDVDDEFSKDFTHTVKNYQDLVAAGGYTFGDLTAKHCKLNPGDRNNWLTDIDKTYPKPVQAILKATVEYALSQPKPIGISFHWHGGPKEVRITYDEMKQHYDINIYGYPIYPLRQRP
jgi:hypothetical protein